MSIIAYYKVKFLHELVLEHLQLEYEEADLRILLYVLDALKIGHKRCIVVSNDTDVVVRLLYNMGKNWNWGYKMFCSSTH